MLVPKFKVGQRVYAVGSVSDVRQKHAECDVCNSTGYVKIEGKDRKFICPVCNCRMEAEHYGYKYLISYYGAKLEEYKQLSMPKSTEVINRKLHIC